MGSKWINYTACHFVTINNLRYHRHWHNSNNVTVLVAIRNRRDVKAVLEHGCRSGKKILRRWKAGKDKTLSGRYEIRFPLTSMVGQARRHTRTHRDNHEQRNCLYNNIKTGFCLSADGNLVLKHQRSVQVQTLPSNILENLTVSNHSTLYNLSDRVVK